MRRTKLIFTSNNSLPKIFSSELSKEISNSSLVYLFDFPSLTIYLFLYKKTCGQQLLSFLKIDQINMIDKQIQWKPYYGVLPKLCLLYFHKILFLRFQDYFKISISIKYFSPSTGLLLKSFSIILLTLSWILLPFSSNS